MNVLPFVVAILMVLSIITYGKLYVFLTQNAIQTQYVCFMKAREKSEFNRLQQVLFDQDEEKRSAKPVEAKKTEQEENLLNEERNFHKGNKGQKPKPEMLNPQNNPVKVSDRLGRNVIRELDFTIFVSPEERQSNGAFYNAMYPVMTRLLEEVYGNQPFFIKAQDKRAHLADQLLQAIIEKSSHPDQKDHMTEIKYLANLDLGDEVLQKVLIEMLKGSPSLSEQMSTCPTSLQDNTGYPKLQDLLNIKLKNNNSKLRLWLASNEVIKALLNDDSLTNHILEERFKLYRTLTHFQGDALKDQKTKITEEFKKLFQNRIPSEFDSYVEYGVTKTQPPYPPGKG